MCNNNSEKGEVTHDFGLGIKFKSLDDYKNPGSSLFKSTDPNRTIPVTAIDLDMLRPFERHPFKLYEGKRFEDMVESIKENGVILPIIIRPVEFENGVFEILSGHNRVAAAKAAGLVTIPAIIRKNLTREEAFIIVTQTNLIQRSFADLSHSERAVALSMHHEAMKKQGRRTDLINEIENLLKNPSNISNNANSETFSQVGHKLKAIEKLGQEYGLSKNSIARYLCINKLTDGLKKRLDNREFGIVPAVEISYLSESEQNNVDMLLDSPSYKLDMKKAAQLRESSEKKPLAANDVEEIFAGLAGKKRNHSPKAPKIVFIPKVISKYFAPDQKPEEIQTEFITALLFYRANKPKEPEESEKTNHLDETEDTEVDINGDGNKDEEKDMGDEPE